MGCSHSTPAPTDVDFQQEENFKPLTVFLCSKVRPTKTMASFNFNVQQNGWNSSITSSETSTIELVDTEIGNLKLEIITTKQKDKTPKCILIIRKDGIKDKEPLAVMILENSMQRNARSIICAFDPPSNVAETTKVKSSCGEHEGRPLYEWAVVSTSTPADTFQMITKESSPDKGTNVSYQTDFFGSFFSHTNIVLKREGLLCASMELEKQTKQWKCRSCPGIDPTMMICFVVCCDKLRENREKIMENAKKHAYSRRMP